jgi:hypothetical protein
MAATLGRILPNARRLIGDTERCSVTFFPARDVVGSRCRPGAEAPTRFAHAPRSAILRRPVITLPGERAWSRGRRAARRKHRRLDVNGRSEMDRRALQRQYRETRRPMGVFRVCNKQSGRWFIGASVDVPAMLNRQRFQLEMGSHPNPALQREWKQLGADAFAFETLDQLTLPEDPAYDPKPDLRTLEVLWRERLGALYGPGYHDETTAGV